VTPEEKAAISKFEAELLATKAEVEGIMKEGNEAAAQNPLAALVPMKALCNKIQQVKGEGLPAELKTAWTDMSGSFAKMAEIFKDFPDKPSEMEAWIVKTVGTDPVALQKWQTDFQTNLMKVQADGDVAVKKFNEVAPKYGLDPKVLK
jgi:hypothetical protein